MEDLHQFLYGMSRAEFDALPVLARDEVMLKGDHEAGAVFSRECLRWANASPMDLLANLEAVRDTLTRASHITESLLHSLAYYHQRIKELSQALDASARPADPRQGGSPSDN